MKALGKVFDVVVAWVFVLIIIGLLGAAAVWTGSHIYRAFFGPEPVAVVVGEWQHWIQPGDTLSQLAITHYPGRDWREVVWEIEQLNPGISSGLLQIGQMVMMPEVK